MSRADVADPEMFKAMALSDGPSAGSSQEELPAHAVDVRATAASEVDIPPRPFASRASGPGQVYIRREVEWTKGSQMLASVAQRPRLGRRLSLTPTRVGRGSRRPRRSEPTSVGDSRKGKTGMRAGPLQGQRPVHRRALRCCAGRMQAPLLGMRKSAGDEWLPRQKKVRSQSTAASPWKRRPEVDTDDLSAAETDDIGTSPLGPAKHDRSAKSQAHREDENATSATTGWLCGACKREGHSEIVGLIAALGVGARVE